MSSPVKIFQSVIILTCIVGMFIFGAILIDGFIGLESLPLKNGLPYRAPLFGNIDIFYQSKGLSLDWFVRIGLEHERYKIYTGLYVVPQLFAVSVFMLSQARRKIISNQILDPTRKTPIDEVNV